MTIIRVLGWLGASALSVGVALSSYAISNEVRSPVKTLLLGVPPTAIASGNAALASFGTRHARDPQAKVSEKELALAQRAYRAEPLSTSAVALQGLAMMQNADAAKGQALLELGGKLTRRNTLITNALIESAAKRNDDKSFFTWLSRMMLTNSDAGHIYAVAMADATARDGAVEALTPVIGPDPRWAQRYWRLVVRRPDSLINAATLRIAIAKKPWSQTAIEQTDNGLVSGLVGIGQFDLAKTLADTLNPRASRSQANLLTNASFGAAPILPPFDWELSALGNLGASVDEKDKQLNISAVAGARAPAARQLLRLAPGDYRLNWTLSSSSPLAADTLTARIRCAEPNVASAAPLPITLVAGKQQANVRIGDGACQWHWLSIEVSVPDDSMGIDASLSGLSLAAVG